MAGTLSEKEHTEQAAKNDKNRQRQGKQKEKNVGKKIKKIGKQRRKVAKTKNTLRQCDIRCDEVNCSNYYYCVCARERTLSSMCLLTANIVDAG